MVKKNVENRFVGLIEHVRQLIKNGTLSQDVKYITLNNVRVYKSLPIISKKTVNVGDKDLGQQIRNNEEFEVMDIDDKTITIKSEITNEIIKIKHEELKHFQLGYCMTCHSSQGSTFDFDYSIYE